MSKNVKIINFEGWEQQFFFSEILKLNFFIEKYVFGRKF